MPPAWPVALAVLPAGFAVAELTGVRALGGAVLVAGGLAAVAIGRRAPRPRRLAWGAMTFALFVASHLLGELLGSWPAVAIVAGAAGAAGWWLLDCCAPLPGMSASGRSRSDTGAPTSLPE